MEFVQYQDRRRQYLGLVFVVLLHFAIVYALVAGLARRMIEVIPSPIQAEIVDDVQTEEAMPEPPPPPLDMPTAPYVPPPEIEIRQPPPPQSNAITRTSSDPTTKDLAPRPYRTAPEINANSNCPKPEYPALSMRLGESGTVVLEFLIGRDGRVHRSRVEQSSGHPRLDEAARRALSRCKFVPGTINGKPTEAWAKLQYTWQMPR